MASAEALVATLRVSARREALGEALAAYLRPPRRLALWHHEVEPLLPTEGGEHVAPFWATVEQREILATRGCRNSRGVAGRALAPVSLNGECAFLVWVEACIEPTDGGASATPACLWAEAVEALWVGAAAAIRQYPHAWPLDPRRDLRFRVLDVDGAVLDLREERIEGGSLGLAAAVATWSALARRPVRGDLVFTGLVASLVNGTSAQIREVHHVEVKAKEAVDAGLRLCAPGESARQGHISVEPIDTVADALAAAFGPKYEDPSQCPAPPRYDTALALAALDLAYRANAGGHGWLRLGQRLQHLAGAPTLPRVLRPVALARAGACFGHAGRTLDSLPLLRDAIALVDAGVEVDGPDEVVARTHLANGLRADYDFGAAAEQAERAWHLAERLRLHKDGVNARSTLGQVLMGAGRVEEALEHLRHAVDYYDARRSPECPRNHCYVVDAFARLGRFEDAERERRIAEEHLRDAPVDQQRNHGAFLAYALLGGRVRHLRRAAATSADWAQVAAQAEQALKLLPRERVWPRAGLERVRAAAQFRMEPEEARPETLERLRRDARELELNERASIPAWQLRLGIAEAALVAAARGEAAAARALADEVTQAVPPQAARWLEGEIRSIRGATPESLRDAIFALLDREQY